MTYATAASSVPVWNRASRIRLYANAVVEKGLTLASTVLASSAWVVRSSTSSGPSATAPTIAANRAASRGRRHASSQMLPASAAGTIVCLVRMASAASTAAMLTRRVDVLPSSAAMAPSESATARTSSL